MLLALCTKCCVRLAPKGSRLVGHMDEGIGDHVGVREMGYAQLGLGTGAGIAPLQHRSNVSAPISKSPTNFATQVVPKVSLAVRTTVSPLADSY